MTSFTSPFTDITMYTRSGARIDQFHPDIRHISWRLNDYGEMSFFLPYTAPLCTPEFLAYGNLIVVQFFTGLQPFVGVIDTPRSRVKDGIVVTAYSGERMFYFRETDGIVLRYEAEAPGNIFADLLNRINAAEPTALATGYIYSGGDPKTIEYNAENVIAVLRNLAADSGEEFDVTPTLTETGSLIVQANWYERKGVDRTGAVLLSEGYNYGRPTLDEQGPVISNLRLLGGGITYDEDRLQSLAESSEARIAYGLRQSTEVRAEIKNQDTLDVAASNRLALVDTARMRMTLDNVIDSSTAPFGAYGMGDIVKVSAFHRGSKTGWAIEQTPWRIIGRQWNPDNTCRVEVEEWAA